MTPPKRWPLEWYRRSATKMSRYKEKLHTVPSGSNIQKIDLIDFVIMDNDGQLRGILKSHLAYPERPQHDLQEIFIGNIFVPFDSGDS